MPNTEREDLQNLSTHPGWLRLKEWAANEWSDQIQEHIGHAANERDDVAALNKLRQVIAAKKAVFVVLDWPERRLKQLDAVTEREHALPSFSRRGTL